MIDHARLDQVCGGDAAIQRQLLLEYRRVNDADAEKLRQAIDGRDHGQCLRLLHRIKGAARGLGASDFLAACESMELSATLQPTTALADELRNFRDALGRLNGYLDSIGVRG